MRKLSLLAAILPLFLAGLTGSAWAQEQVVVNFKLSANQPSLFDDKAHDTYKGSIDDALGIVTLNFECSAGQKGLFGVVGRVDETCGIMDDPKSTGIIKNPANPSQTVKRIDYLGGYVIKAKEDGYTDMTTLLAKYGQAGGAKDSSFMGFVKMKPENPTIGVTDLAKKALEYVKDKADGDAVTFNDEYDSIEFVDFTTPESGQKGSQACSWNGPGIFLYATDSWQMNLTLKCGAEAPVQLNGNVFLVDAPEGSDHDQEYQINLMTGEGNGDPFAEADPFAVVPGITGTLAFRNSGRESDGVYEKVEVTGQITGTGLPAEAVRGFSQIVLTFPRLFFGA